MTRALRLGQQGNKGRFQAVGAGFAQQLRRRTLGQHLAAIDGREPVKTRGLFHIGRGHHHAHTGSGCADALDERPELPAGQGVHPGGGLVEDQQVGIVNQGAAQAELLLHAAGELARRTPREGCKAGGLKQLGNTPLPLCRAVAEKATEEVDILMDREGVIEIFAKPLGHKGDPRAYPAAMAFAGDIAPQHLDPPLLYHPGARQQGQQA